MLSVNKEYRKRGIGEYYLQLGCGMLLLFASVSTVLRENVSHARSSVFPASTLVKYSVEAMKENGVEEVRTPHVHHSDCIINLLLL